jgi:hypothetical protein
METSCFLIFRIPEDGHSPETQWFWVLYTPSEPFRFYYNTVLSSFPLLPSSTCCGTEAAVATLDSTSSVPQYRAAQDRNTATVIAGKFHSVSGSSNCCSASWKETRKLHIYTCTALLPYSYRFASISSHYILFNIKMLLQIFFPFLLPKWFMNIQDCIMQGF